jgi:microsomal dipeptidase-like Zn-dependent dipeptidase
MSSQYPTTVAAFDAQQAGTKEKNDSPNSKQQVTKYNSSMTAETALTLMGHISGKQALSSQSSFIMQLEENPDLPYPEVKKMRQTI